MLTPENISHILSAPAEAVATAWPRLCAALAEQGIDTSLVRIGAAATLAVECAGWVPVAERRAKEGSRVWKLQERYWPSGYYGRGPIQLTGLRNYRDAGQALGLDLLGHPELALDPAHVWRIFAWFFKTSGAARACEARDWDRVRLRVNGPGLIHLDQFKGYVARLLEVL